MMNSRTVALLLAILMSLTSCRSPRDVAQGAPAWYESQAFWMGTASAVGGGFLTSAIDEDADNDVVLGVSALLFTVGWFFGNQQDLEWARLTQDTPPWLLDKQPGTDSRYDYRENKNINR